MRTHSKEEFIKLAEPTLQLMDLEALKQIPHHTTSRLIHCLHVAYLSYVISCRLGCNSHSIIKGALLHDYFEESGKGSFTMLFKHPGMAVTNSKNIFDLNKVEIDIIKNHMFPLTVMPPRHIESWIVNSVDKYCATIEYLTLLNTQYFRDILQLAQQV